MRKRLLGVVALAALLPATAFALNDTPAPTPAGTSTPAATASPDTASDRSKSVAGVPAAQYFIGTQTFEGGIEVGSTALGATKLDFIKRVKCTVDPVAMTLPTQTTTVRCAATGTVATDYANCALPIASAAGAVIKSVSAATDAIDIELVAISERFPDVGEVAIQCLVVR
jgi:hypothetical protein